MKSNKDICGVEINLLNEDGFFDNEWIDEHKFRPRFFKATAGIEVTPSSECISKFIGIAELISKDIIRENIDSTLDRLQSKGIVNEVTTESGDTGFILNKDYKHE